MKLSKFKFNLPQELIALHPAKNRDESRLMIVNRKTGEIEHKVFKDLLFLKRVFLKWVKWRRCSPSLNLRWVS